MTPEDFIEDVRKEDNTDYGLCPPPVKADKGMQVLIDHFLGEDWYVTLPLSTEQVYTEAIYAILEKNRKKSIRGFFKRLFNQKIQSTPYPIKK